MADTTVLEVGSEDVLWDFLQDVLENPEFAASVQSLQISGWSPQLLYFPDETIGHTIRPAAARALDEYHRCLQRGYALLLHGQADLRVLTAADKERLDIPFLITDGSTGSKVLDAILDKLIDGLLANMTGPQKLTAIVIFIIAFFGHVAALDWFEKNHNLKIADMASKERIEMGEQEIARMKIFAEALGRSDLGKALNSEADKSKRALVKPAAQGNSSRVLGVDITKEQAQRVLAQPAEETKGVRLDGVYKVTIINTESENGFVVRLENKDTGREVVALASRAELTEEDIHLIFETAEKKTFFRGAVNAFFTGDKITRAYLMRADSYNLGDGE